MTLTDEQRRAVPIPTNSVVLGWYGNWRLTKPKNIETTENTVPSRKLTRYNDSGESVEYLWEDCQNVFFNAKLSDLIAEYGFTTKGQEYWNAPYDPVYVTPEEKDMQSTRTVHSGASKDTEARLVHPDGAEFYFDTARDAKTAEQLINTLSVRKWRAYETITTTETRAL